MICQFEKKDRRGQLSMHEIFNIINKVIVKINRIMDPLII
jgi:hypothetical protein